jgi:hypothetical protein
MAEYHDSATSTMQSQSSAVTLDSWQQFIADYEAELGDGKATFNFNTGPQSIQEEYTTYVMGALSAGSTSDTLGFWRVSICYGMHTH